MISQTHDGRGITTTCVAMGRSVAAPSPIPFRRSGLSAGVLPKLAQGLKHLEHFLGFIKYPNTADFVVGKDAE